MRKNHQRKEKGFLVLLLDLLFIVILVFVLIGWIIEDKENIKRLYYFFLK